MTNAARQFAVMVLLALVGPGAGAATAAGAASVAGPASAPSAATVRSGVELDRRQRAADARYLDEKAACQTLFAVNECLERAKAGHREATEQIRRERQRLDEAVRRERAASRARAIAENEARRQALGPEPPASPPAARSAASRVPPDPGQPRPARAAAPASRPAAPPASASSPRVTARPAASAEQRRRQRASEAERRRLEAEDHRREVLRRNAERDQKRPPVAGLPIPGPASAAGGVR